MTETSICIIGAGVTGLSLLLLLESRSYPLENVTIIDPQFDGGDLARKWTTTQSNTPWSKSNDTLRQTCPGVKIPAEFLERDQNESCPLADLARMIRMTAASALSRVNRIHAIATTASFDPVTNIWSVAHKGGVVKSKKIVLALGSECKSLDLEVSSIPLENALDANRLSYLVKPGHRVIVVGTMHSGTLIMENLSKIGAKVTGLYNTAKPFYWDRDGEYDGVKGEAASIADAITRGEKPQIQLVHVQDISNVFRACSKADWVIYAMGFYCRQSIRLDMAGEQLPLTYDGMTGRLDKCQTAWGFGVGFPNRAPDGIHWDVSVAAFLKHMEAQLPAIIS